MSNPITALYERLTGRPYYSGRTASQDFGPTPGAEIAEIFGAVSADLLWIYGPSILAQARRFRQDRIDERLVDEPARAVAVRPEQPRFSARNRRYVALSHVAATRNMPGQRCSGRVAAPLHVAGGASSPLQTYRSRDAAISHGEEPAR